MSETDERLRRSFASVRLSEEKVSRILAAGKSVRVRRSLPAWLAVAACVSFLLILAPLVFKNLAPDPRKPLAREVWKNHSKNLAPEIWSSSMEEIDRRLDRLDLPGSVDQFPGLAGLRIKGGRYCTLNGELAAQIDLESGDGQRRSLYIAPLSGELSKIQPGIVSLDTGEVEFFVEDASILAVAR
jgi:hypothetical protein